MNKTTYAEAQNASLLSTPSIQMNKHTYAFLDHDHTLVVVQSAGLGIEFSRGGRSETCLKSPNMEKEDVQGDSPILTIAQNSSVPFVQAVLRGSLLHFCFVFFSASIAILLIHVCVAGLKNDCACAVACGKKRRLSRALIQNDSSFAGNKQTAFKLKK